ncbi:hypothetical protein IVA96_23925 [Bradyrhizobium sp. 159]|uniref:KAP family NTPase n=1 Tax=Bradyrhizobium sp. 159 TaxID=2782632 RepID=UPI001FF799BE|nr:KAP family NTPase [Bradyrhizobium sp. 159]MCK1619568.1 hypothetical protein [Bradyrhizobium sp. 159]
MPDPKNQHLLDYLGYYLSLTHSPRYAVLISGPWGVGKTYQVKRFLQHHRPEPKKLLYVSLYGLSTLDEIRDALFQAAYPLLTGKPAKLFGSLLTAGLKYVKVDTGSISVGDVIGFSADVYVFDDLERYEGNKSTALGYINQFVEHEGAKVIIIANDKEIKAGEDYERRKEKLIGKVLEVQSSFDEAFSAFVALVDDKFTQEFFKKNAEEISSLYKQSKKDNLRILQQTMWDFERVCKAVTDEHRGHPDAMLTLLRLFFVLSFEFKSNQINAEDLEKGRGLAAMVQAHVEKDKEPSPMRRVADRYQNVDIDDSILSSSVLVNCLVRGIVDPNEIQASLNASSFFVKVADEAPWRTVWHWTERTESEVLAAVAKMSEQFEQRAFTIEGEILHVLGLQLFLSDIGVIKSSKRQVVEDGKQYIDDLYKTKKLEATQRDDYALRFDGYGGLGIQSSDTLEYRELFQHLRESSAKALRDTYPEKASELLEVMKTDVQLFYRRLCITNSDDNIYYNTPLLTSLDPDKFVLTMLDLPIADEHVVFMMFKSRYDHSQLDNDLSTEKPWAEAVKRKLLDACETSGPITGKRIKMRVAYYMKAIPDVAAVSGK